MALNVGIDAPQKYQEGEDFEEWLESFELYLCAVGVEGADRKRALLLHVLGKDVQQKLKSVGNAAIDANLDVFEQTKAKLRILLAPKTRPVYERNVFHSMTMMDKDEDIVDFVGRLQKQAQKCQFGSTETDNMIRDVVVAKCPYPGLQVRLLEADNLGLTDVIKMWKSHLQVREQAAKLQSMAPHKTQEKVPKPEAKEDEESGEVCKVTQNKFSWKPNSKFSSRDTKVTCFRCGEEGHRGTNCFKSRGKTCAKCGGKNHFARVCKTKRVQQNNFNKVQGQSGVHTVEDEDDYVFTTTSKSTKLVTVYIAKQPVKVMLDTGASVDILTRKDFKTLTGVQISKTNRRLMPYGCSIPLKLDGQLVATTAVREKEVETCWVVAAKGQVSLLSGTTAQLLGLLELKTDEASAVLGAGKAGLEDILDKNKEVFEENLGKISQVKAKLILKKDAKPVYKKARPVPYALQEAVEKELQKWEEEGVAERVEYAEWASPLVVVPKPGGKVRLCGDYKGTVNPQLEVPQHPMPNLEDILTSLAGTQSFCKLDLSTAYLQMELDEQSQELTILNTPRGLIKMKRLPYGIAASPALFQSAMERILQGIEGVTCFLDDVLIAGTSVDETLKRLDKTLERLKQWNLRLNKGKCQFMLKAVRYLGVEVSAEGIQPVPEKLDPILGAPQPRNQQELRSFLGAVNFYGRFVEDMATTAAPLNRLLQKNTTWKWGREEEKCFQKLKGKLAAAPILAHYNCRQPVRLITDASPYGIGAVLVQKGKDGEERPVRFASRTLTQAERNYSQIEREGLAVIFGVTRFRQYLYGRRFTLVTDNKPLASILGPKTQFPALAAARMQRWALILAAYSYDVEYRRSEEIPMADFLSRLPCSMAPREKEDEATVCFLENMEKLPITAEQVKLASSRDLELAQVAQHLKAGWTEQPPKELESFFKKKDELTITNGCLLWGARVVIPKKLQKQVLEELHDSHPGITKMKMLARSYVWWPKIDQDIEDLVKQCAGCQQNRSERPAVFLHPWEHTKNPWERVHLDFAGPMRGRYYLVLVDSHSKWPEVVPMRDITTSATIRELSSIFARFGIPVQLVSDNGPQLTSQEFENFLQKLGVKHIRVAPYRPQSNGLAERMVQTVKNSLKAALHSGDSRPVELLLASFLMRYRNTEHATTGLAPTEAMLGRRMRTRLDLLRPNMAEKVLHAQAKQMENTSRFPEHQEGDTVLVRNYAGGAKWKTGKVVGRTGPVSYTVNVDGLVWSRHAGQLLKMDAKRGAKQADPREPQASRQAGPPEPRAAASLVDLPGPRTETSLPEPQTPTAETAERPEIPAARRETEQQEQQLLANEQPSRVEEQEKQPEVETENAESQEEQPEVEKENAEPQEQEEASNRRVQSGAETGKQTLANPESVGRKTERDFRERKPYFKYGDDFVKK